jgi:S-formylglutathione hydrolase FrmB
MKIAGFLRPIKFCCCFALLFLVACREKAKDAGPDFPRLTPKVTLRDVTFHSGALNRDMTYRVVLPTGIAAGQKLPAVYLLHGGGSNFRAWSNYSDVARYAERGLILIMPEGHDSYYTNSVEHPQDRYEDYVVNDLISDVEGRFPVASVRANRAIVGISMGGFGAVKLAFRHPELFAFAGGISPAIDVPSRPFSVKRPLQWHYHRSIFGAWGGQAQRDNDPFVLALSSDPAKTPYLFLTCGEQEGLLPANRKFAALLAQRQIGHEFHVVPGCHNWTQWNERLDSCFHSLLEHMTPKS